jgi:hypothetical protein
LNDLDAPQLETHEANAFADLYRAPLGEIKEVVSADRMPIGSGWAVMTPTVDILAFNRVIAVGVGEPADDTRLDGIVETFREGGIPRFFFQLAPQAGPQDLAERLAARGFELYNNWVKLYRTVDNPPKIETDLRIEQIGREQAELFANVLCHAFEWPAKLRPMIGSLVGEPGWVHYLAFDGDRPAATAAMYVREEWCWIDFASTAVEYRGRRAQSALIARRLRDAAELGCRHVIVETAEDRPDKPAISCRNVQRLGFQIAYLRPNWLYTF